MSGTQRTRQLSQILTGILPGQFFGTNTPPEPIPDTCKAQASAVFEQAGQPLVLKDVPVKSPAEGEVLIKVAACGVCHGDLSYGKGEFGDDFPRIPGHEVIGDVVAVGPGESKWRVGDRVGGGWHGGHDGTCDQCKRGDFNLCTNEQINGITADGGYAEYCTLRTEAVVNISRDLDPAKAAPLLCAGVTLFNTVRRMNIERGRLVAIQGIGGLGHLGVQYVRKMGYRTVALSSGADKREHAFELGAHEYIDGNEKDHGEELQHMGGAALVVVTAPNPAAIPKLVRGCAPGGKILILAPVGDIPLDTVSLILKGISVHGWPAGHAKDTEESIKFARSNNINCSTESFPLEQANEALQRMAEGKVRFRGVLVM